MVEIEKGGRRERKKVEMRNALVEAAYALFEEKGFDETRIDDITDKIDVSSRTFFRYFSSKEEVVLDYHAVEYDEIVAAIESRPSDESMITAIRRAVVEVTKGCEEGFYGVDGDRFRTLRTLIRTHPIIRARSLEQSNTWKCKLVYAIANHLKVDPDNDLRPLIGAEMLEAASSTAYAWWKKPERQEEPYYKILDEVFCLLENCLNTGG